MLFLLFSPNILANRKFINKARDRIKIGFKSSYEIKKKYGILCFFLSDLILTGFHDRSTFFDDSCKKFGLCCFYKVYSPYQFFSNNIPYFYTSQSLEKF